MLLLRLLLSISIVKDAVEGWLSSGSHLKIQQRRKIGFRHSVVPSDKAEEEWSDFADMGYTPPQTQINNEDVASPGDDGDLNAKLRLEMQRRQTSRDYTAVSSRQLSLGKDLIVTNYVGDMGFDEVTDWQYYYDDEDEDGRRQGNRNVIQPNPLDPSKYVIMIATFALVSQSSCQTSTYTGE